MNEFRFNICGQDKNGYDKQGIHHQLRKGEDIKIKYRFDAYRFNKYGQDKNGYDKNGIYHQLRKGDDKKSNFRFNVFSVDINGDDEHGDVFNYEQSIDCNHFEFDPDYGSVVIWNKKPSCKTCKLYSWYGYDRDGYDKHGYNYQGFYRDCYDKNGYDRHGIHRDLRIKHGISWDGLNWKGKRLPVKLRGPHYK